jgi:hypothetical protein
MFFKIIQHNSEELTFYHSSRWIVTILFLIIFGFIYGSFISSIIHDYNFKLGMLHPYNSKHIPLIIGILGGCSFWVYQILYGFAIITVKLYLPTNEMTVLERRLIRKTIKKYNTNLIGNVDVWERRGGNYSNIRHYISFSIKISILPDIELALCHDSVSRKKAQAVANLIVAFLNQARTQE